MQVLFTFDSSPFLCETLGNSREFFGKKSTHLLIDLAFVKGSTSCLPDETSAQKSATYSSICIQNFWPLMQNKMRVASVDFSNASKL